VGIKKSLPPRVLRREEDSEVSELPGRKRAFLMRRWGAVVTLFFSLALVGLLLPGAVLIAGGQSFDAMQELYSEWLV